MTARSLSAGAAAAGDDVTLDVVGPVTVYPRMEMTRVRRGSILVGALGLVAAIVSVAGCGGGGGKRSIVLYNGQHLELTTALISAFEKQTGIAVRVRTNDSVVLADQILQEGSSSPADVYLAENSPELMNLSEKGVLARLPRSVLGQGFRPDTAPRRATGSALPFGSAASSTTSRSYLEASFPRSILDLARPAWKGKVAIAPLDSDFPPIVGAVIAKYGVKAAHALARRAEAQRRDLPGRGGGGRGRQSRRRRERADQPVLLVPAPARDRARTR